MNFVGEPVALIVTKSCYLAEDALELVDVDYETLPAVIDFTRIQFCGVLAHDNYPNKCDERDDWSTTRRVYFFDVGIPCHCKHLLADLCDCSDRDPRPGGQVASS